MKVRRVGGRLTAAPCLSYNRRPITFRGVLAKKEPHFGPPALGGKLKTDSKFFSLNVFNERFQASLIE